MTRIVLLTGRLPPERDNIGEYTLQLQAAMYEHMRQTEVWALYSRGDQPHTHYTSFARYKLTALKVLSVVTACRRRPCILVWQFNPFMYGWKGCPVLLYLLPILVKLTSASRVTVIYHEIAMDPRGTVRTWIWTVWHHVGLWFMLLGSDASITTTRPRRDYVARFAQQFLPRAWACRVFAAVPVGTTITVMEADPRTAIPSLVQRIGAFHPGPIGPEISQVIAAFHWLHSAGIAVQLVLIGGGTSTGLARSYHPLDSRPGIVETGYLSSGDASRVLGCLDVFVGVYRDGASGRRTSLAAAFAHGLCVVSTTGPNTDRYLARHGDNCLLVSFGDTIRLGEALKQVIEDVQLRQHLAQRALETYLQELTWPIVAERVLDIIDAS